MFNFLKRKNKVLHVKDLVKEENYKAEYVLKAIYEYGEGEIEEIPDEMFKDAELMEGLLEYHPKYAKLIPENLFYWYKRDIGYGVFNRADDAVVFSVRGATGAGTGG